MPNEPLSPLFDEHELREMPETPAPQRARVNNLNKQVDKLVKERHTMTRKAQADQAALQETINRQRVQMNEQDRVLREVQAMLKGKNTELERCKAEGDGMRDELNMYAVLHQQKALLALAEEQMHVIELEQRLVKAEQARVMRDHKLTMFQAREADLVADLAEKVNAIEELEDALATANEKISQSSASSAAISSSLSSAGAERSKLESRIAALEASLSKSKAREADLQAEVDAVLSEDKSKDGQADKERKELQKELRGVKAELKRKEDALADVKEELESTTERYKEREKELKARLKIAKEQAVSGPGADDESEFSRPSSSSASKSLKTTSPVKKAKKAASPAKKATPAQEPESDVEAVPSPPKAKVKKTSAKQPLAESSDTNKVPAKVKVTVASKLKEKTEKRKQAEMEEDDEMSAPSKKTKEKLKAKAAEVVEAVPAFEAADGGEKKKKRKFGLKAAPAFQWDPIEGSGTGVIPSTLSPMRVGTGALNIPRAGFPNAASSRILSKLS